VQAWIAKKEEKAAVVPLKLRFETTEGMTTED
jgi:hypothetical protein